MSYLVAYVLPIVFASIVYPIGFVLYGKLFKPADGLTV